MARDARSLVLATQGLGPMFASEGDLAGRIFVPSDLPGKFFKVNQHPLHPNR